MSDYWNGIYSSRSTDERSWSETTPSTSLELLTSLGVSSSDSVIDIGAGESELVDALRERDFHDLSVLDLSRTALDATRRRFANDDLAVIEADVTSWNPPRQYDVWHDRAVLHFLSPSNAQRYSSTLRDALYPGGGVVIGTFALDGPTTCSGLPVTRYGANTLSELLGEEFVVVRELEVVHRTPWGGEQPFQWIAARRHGHE